MYITYNRQTRQYVNVSTNRDEIKMTDILSLITELAGEGEIRGVEFSFNEKGDYTCGVKLREPRAAELSASLKRAVETGTGK